MSADVKEFFGKDIASAIKEACDTLGVAQELLNIEVIETGSKGIFGLISKKAHIRVTVQDDGEPGAEEAAEPPPAAPEKKVETPETGERATRRHGRPRPATPGKQSSPAAVPADAEDDAPDASTAADDSDDDDDDNGREPVELSEETLTVIRNELGRLLELMNCPSSLTVLNNEGIAECRVSPDYEELLTNQEGRALDSLQYLLRKIVSKKLPGRVQITIDVGNYRERRSQELRERALELADTVKQSGKTQVIPSLNPSERRIIHLALQDDPDIRSRSIGEGLFKKVLIYKPGKGRRGNGRKRPRARQRRKNAGGSRPKK